MFTEALPWDEQNASLLVSELDPQIGQFLFGLRDKLVIGNAARKTSINGRLMTTSEF